jgi:hypothetical protein
MIGRVDTNTAVPAAGVDLVSTETDTGHMINVGAGQFRDWLKQAVQPPDDGCAVSCRCVHVCVCGKQLTKCYTVDQESKFLFFRRLTRVLKITYTLITFVLIGC